MKKIINIFKDDVSDASKKVFYGVLKDVREKNRSSTEGYGSVSNGNGSIQIYTTHENIYQFRVDNEEFYFNANTAIGIKDGDSVSLVVNESVPPYDVYLLVNHSTKDAVYYTRYSYSWSSTYKILKTPLIQLLVGLIGLLTLGFLWKSYNRFMNNELKQHTMKIRKEIQKKHLGKFYGYGYISQSWNFPN